MIRTHPIPYSHSVAWSLTHDRWNIHHFKSKRDENQACDTFSENTEKALAVPQKVGANPKYGHLLYIIHIIYC